ncbi:Tankyrase-1 [Armadillidium vulgare]|nr:Tankyrase-1 [Armadillidium vulgare]
MDDMILKEDGCPVRSARDEENSDNECDGKDCNFEDLLLKSARNGNFTTVSEILKAFEEGKATLDINCKGKSKCNLGWTPLHLSCYFGHKECVEILLHKGAQVDIQNDSGDTPLHKAALTNREEIVMLLLEHGASVSTINGEGLRASDLGRKSQVRKLILGAEKAEHKIREEKFIHAAREGDVELIKKIVQTALELVQTQQMEQVLAVPPVKSFSRNVSRFEGPLLRKMRIVGWRMVWCVLERGVLTFFNSRADASSGVGRRDYKYLDSAKLVSAIGGEQSAFLIQYSDRTRHRLAALPDPVHSASVNRQKWVSALADHIKFSTHYVQHGFSIDDDDEDEKRVKPLGCMQDALATAKAHQELLEQQVQEVMALISYLNDDKLKQGSVHNIVKKFTFISSTAKNMTSSLNHCLSLMKQQEEVRELLLKEEKEKVRVLEESLRVLAAEHHDLEESIAERLSSSSDGVSLYNTPANSFMSIPRPRRFFPTGVDDEFFDAYSQDDDTCTLKSLPSPCGSECSTNTLVSCMSSLPLDPLPSDNKLPNASSSITSHTSSVHSLGEKDVGVSYTKLTSTSSFDKELNGSLNIENESIETISSGNCLKNSTATESLSLASSLTGVTNGASVENNSNNPITDTPSLLSVSTTPSSLLLCSVTTTSRSSYVSPELSHHDSLAKETTLASEPLPETPLLRTSDLSDEEKTDSGNSDDTISSQDRDGAHIEGCDTSSSFSLIYLGGTRYKGAHGGRRRLWRNWGRLRKV